MIDNKIDIFVLIFVALLSLVRLYMGAVELLIVLVVSAIVIFLVALFLNTEPQPRIIIPVPDKPNKKKSPRTLLAEELFKTEETYVETLHILTDVFMAEFEESTKERHPPLTNDQCKAIFSSLVVIKGFNDVLLDDLSQRLSDWDDQVTLLGDTFLKLGDFLKLYNSYCVNYAAALKTLSLCDKNPAFVELLQACEANPRVNHQPLVSLLVTPIQRLPRYLMLLKRLLEETDSKHPDYKNLEKAYQQMEKITGRVNEDLRSATEMNRIYRLQEKLDCEFQLIAPARYLVKEQRKLKHVLPSGKSESCDVFLFNDLVIVVVAPKILHSPDLAATMAPKLKLRSHCEFAHATVALDTEENTQFRLKITHTSDKYIKLQFPSKEMRDDWFQLFTQQIRTTKEKLAAFVKEATRSASQKRTLTGT